MRHGTVPIATGLKGLTRVLGLGLALALTGCGQSEVGSVEFSKPIDARTIGAPRRNNAAQSPARPPRRSAGKAKQNTQPG